MGLLAYNPYDPRMNPMLRNVTPFSQPQAPEGQGAGPVMFPPQAQKPPEPVTPQLSPWASAWQGLTGRDQLKPGASMTDRLNASMESPLFNLGMGIVASSGPGGTGADFAQYMRGYQQQRQQREQLRRQNTREDEQFSWMRDERAQQTQRRQLADRYIAGRPASEQAELRMIDPDNLGTYIQQARQLGIQERGIDLQIEEMRQRAREHRENLGLGYSRIQADRALNSAEALLGRGEAERVNNWMARLDNWSLIDNDLGALEEILQRNPEAFNHIFEPDVEVALSRIRDPQLRADVTTIYATAGNLAREELRGQTPVSNIDILSTVRGSPNPSSGHIFARQWLERAYQDRLDLQNRVQSALQYRDGGDGGRPRTLYTPDPNTGQNWYQSEGYTRYGAGGSFGGNNREPTAEQREAAEALARRRASAPSEGAPAGTIGGYQDAPRLLRTPRPGAEQVLVREYQEARRNGQPQRAREMETQLRRRGLIP